MFTFLLTSSSKYDKILVEKRCRILLNNKEGFSMKSTGIVRRVDELGRVVIPIEIRNKFDIKEKDPI